MKLTTFTRFCAVFVLVVLFYNLYRMNIRSGNVESEEANALKLPPQNIERDVIVAVVACGDRLRETLTMLKSAIMFSKIKISFIVLTEDNLIDNFTEKLTEWKQLTSNKFDFRVMPLTFPEDSQQEWKRLFKPCAAQRLFLPTVLHDVDSILYMDTDTLFLTPVEMVWDHFKQMNSSQMAALVPEHEDPNVGWYNRFAGHPYYGKLGCLCCCSFHSFIVFIAGVNSGVMLMNLTKMREFQWVQYVVPIYKKYKLKITWGDQDIINIIFHFHPDKLYIYPCMYNFRPDHCMYMSVCKSAEKNGVAILHGSRGFFHSEKQPVFQAIYRAFEEFQLEGDIYQDFYLPLENYLEVTMETNCGHIKEAYLKNVKKYIEVKENR